MIFEAGELYHVYNQGNNRENIFFSRENYLFFLNKIKKHILPHADILAWCLMPNHFHLMIYVHDLSFTHQMTESHQMSNDVSYLATHQMTESHQMSKVKMSKNRTFQESIAIMLRSYTRAINFQEDRTGSLFKSHTKAECITKLQGITPSFFGSQINVRIPEKEYPKVCFNYIHQNPVNAKLVKRPEEWEFSSYRDYYGFRNGKLINRARAAEFELINPDCYSSDD